MVDERVPLDLKDTLDYRTVLGVGSRAVVEHAYTLHCKRRGYFPVGPLTLGTGDLFGFADATWEEAHPVYVTVYPQVVSLHELGLPRRSPFGVLPARQRALRRPEPHERRARLYGGRQPAPHSTGRQARTRTGCWLRSSSPPFH